jgi:hypothetical protein
MPIIVAIVMVGLLFVVEHPELMPGYGAVQRHKKQKAIDNDRKKYKDVTELVVSMGAYDPRPDGWYGFDAETTTMIMYFEGSKYSETAYYTSGQTAQQILEGLFLAINRRVATVIERAELKAQLEAMTADRVVLSNDGKRGKWIEDS